MSTDTATRAPCTFAACATCGVASRLYYLELCVACVSGHEHWYQTFAGPIVACLDHAQTLPEIDDVLSDDDWLGIGASFERFGHLPDRSSCVLRWKRLETIR